VRRVIIVGTGAGGATVAKELTGKFDVTILDAGREFHPFGISLEFLGKVRRSGLFFDEREIQIIFPTMRIQKTADQISLVKGIGLGGTTTLATANALRCDSDLKAIGINLDGEFEELRNEIPITTEHQNIWRRSTRCLFEICKEMGLDPRVTPKMVDYTKCKRCGHCVLGCPEGAKWDTREFVDTAVEHGAYLEPNCKVRKIMISQGEATGVVVQQGWRKKFMPADLIIVSAGGFGTPGILSNSGIETEPNLFVDPVLCVAAESRGAFQNKEVLMPFVVQREHFIISPYFDQLSFFFNREWRIPAENIVSLMIKLADENVGRVVNGKFEKSLSELDKDRLHDGVEICKEILSRFGVAKKDMFLGTLNAGHPGGMFPLTQREAETFHHDRLPENLYIADASLFPRSLGNPPMLTIMAMAKRVSKLCVEKFAA
jgi:choline dehydrogenase-like flavoprotein